MFNRLCLLALLWTTTCAAQVTHSILPTIEKAERLDLKRSMLTQRHWKRLQKAKDKIDQKLRVMSYNMLFTVYENKLPKEHHWVKRKDRVAELVHHVAADLICPQELLQKQVEDLMERVGSDYHFIGYRSTDGIAYRDRAKANPRKKSWELNGFFFRKDRLELLEERVWWLSKTPDYPSFAPGSKAPRTLTMGKFLDKVTGDSFYAFNTHLTFGKIENREFEAELIKGIIGDYDDLPCLFAGDLNAFPLRPDMNSLPFWDGDSLLELLTENNLNRSDLYPLLGHIGPLSTYTNAKQGDVRPFQGIGVPGVILDHVLINSKFQALIHGVEAARVGGHFPSDHMPVIVDLAYRAS